jgi:hypothetical protein
MVSSLVKPLLLRLAMLLVLLLLLLKLSEAAGLCAALSPASLFACFAAGWCLGAELGVVLLLVVLVMGEEDSAAACAAVVCLRAKGSLAGPCSGSASEVAVPAAAG